MLTEIKLERIRREILQVQLAKLAGISVGRLSQIENGWYNPRPDEIRRIKEALNKAPTNNESRQILSPAKPEK